MARLFNNFVALWLLLGLGLSGCASKTQKRTELPPELGGDSRNATPVKPADPDLPLPPTSQQNYDLPRREKGGVILVVAGAGVASFALVGVLKRFQKEGIRVDQIVATGWPAVFALGFGFLRTVHDVEWFANRLTESDFKRIGEIGVDSQFSPDSFVSKTIEAQFGKRDLNECRIPIIVSAANTDLGEAETFDKGEWKTPLVKTMSIPGVYRKFSKQSGWVKKAEAIDVDEAVKLRGNTIVAISMYDDFFEYLKNKAGSADGEIYTEYLKRLRQDLQDQTELAQVRSKVTLGKPAFDFSQVRLAIVKGYQEGARIAKQIKALR